MRLTDRQLAEETTTGSTDSFGQLVRRYGGRIMRYVSTRVANVHDAEDLVQDIFVQAYMKIDQYDSKWPFRTWLYTIASRVVIGYFRLSARKQLDGDVNKMSDSMEGGADPFELAAAGEASETLWNRARETLSHDSYAAIHLRYGEGMSIKDIARILGKSSSHIKVMLHRSREKLREAIPSGRAEFLSRHNGFSIPVKGDGKCSVSISDAR